MKYSGVKGPWSYSKQHGTKEYCFVAQVWDSENHSLAVIETTSDPDVASATALLISKAPEMLEKLRQILNLSENTGRAGCTYGDTEYSSLDVVYGYNLALEHVKKGIEQLIKEATHDI